MLPPRAKAEVHSLAIVAVGAVIGVLVGASPSTLLALVLALAVVSATLQQSLP